MSWCAQRSLVLVNTCPQWPNVTTEHLLREQQSHTAMLSVAGDSATMASPARPRTARQPPGPIAPSMHFAALQPAGLTSARAIDWMGTVHASAASNAPPQIAVRPTHTASGQQFDVRSDSDRAFSARSGAAQRGLTPAGEEDTSEAAGGDVDQFTKLTDQSEKSHHPLPCSCSSGHKSGCSIRRRSFSKLLCGQSSRLAVNITSLSARCVSSETRVFVKSREKHVLPVCGQVK